MRRLWAAVGLIGALAFGGLAHAQAVQQSGPVTPFDPTVFTGNGVVADGGGPANPGVGQLGLFNGGVCPFAIASTTGPGPITAQAGQVLICQTLTATTLKVQGLNGAPSPAFFVNIGGVNYPFPGSGSGNVVGPNSSTVGQSACFNNLTGTLITGCAGGARLTRAQIPSNVVGIAQTITVSGYRTANDMGAGQIYSSVSCSSTGWQAIQDAGGTWFCLVSPVADPGAFGAYGDGTAHAIASGDITANPQWRGQYTVGMSSDYVAIQESLYYGFAATALPNTAPTSIPWNSKTGAYAKNLPWHEQNGTFYVSNGVTLVGSSVNLTWDGPRSSCWLWEGTESASNPMLFTDSISYGPIKNICLENSQIGLTPGSGSPLWVLDWDGTYPGLKTQNLLITNGFFAPGGINNHGVSLNPVGGGSAQGSTITFINAEFAGSPSTDFCLRINGSNALNIEILNSDFQGCPHDAIQQFSGSTFIHDASFENQAANGIYPM